MLHVHGDAREAENGGYQASVRFVPLLVVRFFNSPENDPIPWTVS